MNNPLEGVKHTLFMGDYSQDSNLPRTLALVIGLDHNELAELIQNRNKELEARANEDEEVDDTHIEEHGDYIEVGSHEEMIKFIMSKGYTVLEFGDKDGKPLTYYFSYDGVSIIDDLSVYS
jgi:hypothetical protein